MKNHLLLGILISIFQLGTSQVTSIKMDYGKDFFEGYAYGKKGSKQFVIDSTGNHWDVSSNSNLAGEINSIILYGNNSSDIYSFKEGKVIKTLPGRVKYFDGFFIQNLNEKYSILSSDYKVLHTFKENLPSATYISKVKYLGDSIFHYTYVPGPYKMTQFKLISCKGKKLGDFAFDKIGEFHSGLAKFLTKDEYGEEKWGYVNTKGEQVISAKFSKEPSDFYGNRAFIKYKSGEYGMINLQGVPVTKDIFDSYISLNSNRYFVVVDATKSKMIVDSVGHLVKNLNDKAQYFTGRKENSEMLLYKDYKIRLWGLMDFNGNAIGEQKFKELGPLVSNRAYVTFYEGENKRKGYINEKGEIIILFALESNF